MKEVSKHVCHDLKTVLCVDPQLQSGHHFLKMPLKKLLIMLLSLISLTMKSRSEHLDNNYLNSFYE